MKKEGIMSRSYWTGGEIQKPEYISDKVNTEEKETAVKRVYFKDEDREYVVENGVFFSLPNGEKKTKRFERKEENKGFEAEARELLEFLDTPFNEFYKKSGRITIDQVTEVKNEREYHEIESYGEEGMPVADPFKVLDIIQEKIEKIIDSGEDKKKISSFLKNLIIEKDKPAIFFQDFNEAFTFDKYDEIYKLYNNTEEANREIKKRYPFYAFGEPYGLITEDILTNYKPSTGLYDSDHHEGKVRTSWKTMFYQSVIYWMSLLGEDAKNDVFDLLKKFIKEDNLTYDIRERDYYSIEHELEYWSNDMDESSIDMSELSFPIMEAIACLEKNSTDKEEINFFVNLIKDGEFYFLHNMDDIIKILNKKPEQVVKNLLGLLQEYRMVNGERGKKIKEYITTTLYHLEFGKIRMTSEGVEYLNKQYDLGKKYNNSNYFAHRVTADGKVGVFGEDKKTLGYFQLYGLDSPEQKLKAEVLEFSYKTLFHPKEKETLEERQEREKVLEEFKEKYFQTYLVDFKKETGVLFNNLSFPEQGWFLWYVQNASEEDKKRAMKFIKKYKETGFKTFLSLEHDRQNGDRILSIGENISTELAEKIFEKYLSIASISESVVKYLKDYFRGDKEFDEQEVDKFTEDILAKAQAVLVEFAKKIESRKVDEKELENELQKIKHELLYFASLFKTIVKNEEKINFSDIKGVELSSKDSEKLEPQEKEEMRQIFVGNRKDEGFPPEYLAARSKEFDEADKKFYILKKDGQVVSFARFNELPNGNLYVGFLNTLPEVKGHAIGSAFFQAALEKEAKNRDVELKVRTNNPVAKNYQKDFGFEIIGDPIREENGKEYFRMIRRAKPEAEEAELKQAA